MPKTGQRIGAVNIENILAFMENYCIWIDLKITPFPCSALRRPEIINECPGISNIKFVSLMWILLVFFAWLRLDKLVFFVITFGIFFYFFPLWFFKRDILYYRYVRILEKRRMNTMGNWYMKKRLDIIKITDDGNKK